MGDPEPHTDVITTFRGEMSGERAAQLFRQQPLFKRCLTVLMLVALVTGVSAGLWWLLGRKEQPGISHDLAILVTWLFGIWCALRLQSASHRGRNWAQLNGLFCGRYEVALYDKHLDVRNSGIAQRIPYLALSPGRVSTGRHYARVAFDLLEARVLLLPVDDCEPSRTAEEINSLLQERISTARASTVNQPLPVVLENPPLPFDLKQTDDAIPVAGELWQSAAIEVLDDQRQKERKPSRLDRVMTWFMGVMGVLLLGLIITAPAFGKQLPGKMLFLPLMLLAYFGITLYVQRPRSPRPRQSSEPSTSLAAITGWMSAVGFSACTEHGSLAATWASCDAVELCDTQIVVQFWKGEFFVFGRHVFHSEADWIRCVQWIREARSE